MLKIPVIKGNINRSLKTFKIKFKKTSLLKEIIKHKQYTKKSLTRKIQKERCNKRTNINRSKSKSNSGN